MATRRRTQSNPFASANLGSGARTTTGGTYENPRLGIEDYSAFSRGLASTFRMPEKKEVEKKQDLNINLGNFESDKDNFFVDTSGVMQDMSSDISILVNNAWKNGELTELNNSYKNALKGGQEEQNILAHINGYSQAIGPKDSNFVKYFAALDDGVHDHNVSNRQLPGIDGGNLNGTIADFIRIGNEKPSAIKIASKRNSNGIMQYGFEVAGLGFVNASAMTDKWIGKNMNVKYSQASALSDDYKKFQISNFKPMFYGDDETLFKGTDKEFKVKTANEIVQSGSINTFNKIALDAANIRFSSQNDAYFASAIYQLEQDYKNGFKFSKELQAELNKSEGNIPDNLRLRLLKDHYQENFKLTNGSNMYVRGEDGRAIAKTADNIDQFMPDTSITQRDTSEGDSSGSGFNSDNAFDAITTLYGEGRMAGGGQRAGTFKAEEFDLDGAVKYLNDKDQGGNTFFNLYNDQALKDLLATDDLNETNRKKLNDIIRQKSPGSKNRLIAYVDKSGEPQVTKFDGTITSFINVVSGFGAFSSKEESALRNRVDEIYKKGSDIAEYTDPNDSSPPSPPITPRS
tara:strand:+ start:15274 stop:16992 length:1719 start_codon:yes stop_codon:yes gene_type:complete